MSWPVKEIVQIYSAVCQAEINDIITKALTKLGTANVRAGSR